jgi:hypothetical protein
MNSGAVPLLAPLNVETFNALFEAENEDIGLKTPVLGTLNLNIQKLSVARFRTHQLLNLLLQVMAQKPRRS